MNSPAPTPNPRKPILPEAFSAISARYLALESRVTHLDLPFGTADPLRLIHAALGLSTEALELLCAIQRKLPVHEQLLELGDIVWFASLACDELRNTPSDSEVLHNSAPSSGIVTLCDMCEEFASRIKAGIFYGNPAKPTDPRPDYWIDLPRRILLTALSIGDTHLTKRGGLLTMLESKLRARYGDKYSPVRALNRDPDNEATVAVNAILDPQTMLKLTDGITIQDKVKIEKHAQKAQSADDRAREELAALVALREIGAADDVPVEKLVSTSVKLGLR